LLPLALVEIESPTPVVRLFISSRLFLRTSRECFRVDEASLFDAVGGNKCSSCSTLPLLSLSSLSDTFSSCLLAFFRDDRVAAGIAMVVSCNDVQKSKGTNYNCEGGGAAEEICIVVRASNRNQWLE
jgi:hypothetical protein